MRSIAVLTVVAATGLAVGCNDGESSLDKSNEPITIQEFDEEAAQAVLLRSCGTCHGASNAKFSVIKDGQLDLELIRLRAEELAAHLYNAERPMPPKRTKGPPLGLTAEERANLHSYLVYLEGS